MAAPATPNVAKAEKYARDVVAGKILAGKWVILACQRHIDDKKASRAKAYPYKFDKAKAERVAKFVQLLPHTKGKWAKDQERLILEPWQIFAMCVPFGWVKKKTGHRRYHKIDLYIPRKNGKSALAAAIANYMFTADGEYGAEVYSGATTEKQAWEVFRPAKLMVERTPAMVARYGVEVNASNMHIITDGSRFEPIIGKPGDGSSPSCAVVDEYHEHKDSSLYDTMETGMGAREQPILLMITTAGSNIGGPCYTRMRDCQKMLEGAIDMLDTWAVIYMLDEGDDWTTDTALRKANPNYDVSVSGEFLRTRQSDAVQSARKQNTFRTKHLNEWVGAKDAWMNITKWNQAPARKPLSELEGRPCYIALDLATKIDMVATVLLFPPVPDDPLYHVHVRYYLPDARVLDDQGEVNTERYQEFDALGLLTLTMGEVVDFEVIEDDLREFASRFDVQEVPYDPWQAAQLAQNMDNEGLKMVEMRKTVKNLSEPMKQTEALVLQKLIAHGDCPVLNWMVSNVVAREDAKENIYPNKERSENKIDGVVALIMAMARAIVHQQHGDITAFIQDPIIA